MASGPLEVSKINPRYFSVKNSKGIIYLTGSHVNNNFHDGLGFGKNCSKEQEEFNFDEYLAFLEEHKHNFIRLWRWEQFKGYLAFADVHLCMTPQPWLRSGAGSAKDGKAKFDLSKFNPAYFDRLRGRVIAAGKKGMYVSAMLFEGFSLSMTATPDNIEGHPFHSLNNINNVHINSIVDYQVLPLKPEIKELQEAYIRKFVDTLHPLPNVLYEVANESSGTTADSIQMPDGSVFNVPIGNTTEWQYWVINFVKQYEEQMGYDKHPIGMTFQYPVADQGKANDPLWNSPADWISPGFDEGTIPVNSRWRLDPPVNEGKKVIISDTDHYSPMDCDALWAWKSFLRGHNPILYDLGIIMGAKPIDPTIGKPSYNSLEAARYAMGDTLGIANKVNLSEMTPLGELSSTGYVLANPGREYIVLEPNETVDTFTLMLESGDYEVEWFVLKSRQKHTGENLRVDIYKAIFFEKPFQVVSPTVLYLKKK